MNVATPKHFCVCGEEAHIFGRDSNGTPFRVCRECYKKIKARKAQGIETVGDS